MPALAGREPGRPGSAGGRDRFLGSPVDVRRQLDPELRAVIELTVEPDAAALVRDTARAKDAGFYRYLTKPVKVDELAGVLEELLLPLANS